MFYMLNMCSKTEFWPICLNCYLSNEKNTFVENSRAEPTIFLMEKFHFLWNFYLAILWVIKTVWCPLKACMHFVCNCIKFKESELNHFQNLRNGGKGTFQDIFFSHNGVRPYQVCTVVTSILSLSVLIFKILTEKDLMLLHMLKKLVI